MAMADRRPMAPTNVATTNPAIEATAPTDKSIPPVSIAIVWHPARMASGTAARMMPPAQAALTTPGRARVGDHEQARSTRAG